MCNFTGYTHLDKQYFLIKEGKTFHEAAAICSKRNERLVQINNQDENDFISRTIVTPLNMVTWLGAVRVSGTMSFQWLDGSKLIYSNMGVSYPTKGINQHSALAMSASYKTVGKWFDYPISESLYVLCETNPIPSAQSNLTVQSNQRSEFVELVSGVRINSKNYEAQNKVISKLKSQASDIAFEVEYQKRQTDKSISTINADAVKTENRMKSLENQVTLNKKQNDMLIQQNEMLIKQNELLEMRLNRIEHKMSTNVVDNSNKRRD